MFVHGWLCISLYICVCLHYAIIFWAATDSLYNCLGKYNHIDRERKSWRSILFVKCSGMWEDCFLIQVKLSSEYPTRPPQFKLCSVSEGLVRSLPKPPAGVLDVIEKSKISVENFFSFSELHAMEIQVVFQFLWSKFVNWLH